MCIHVAVTEATSSSPAVGQVGQNLALLGRGVLLVFRACMLEPDSWTTYTPAWPVVLRMYFDSIRKRQFLRYSFSEGKILIHSKISMFTY